MCGEKRKKGAVPAPLPGSPPRVRGKVKDSLLDCPQSGITPACAGKSHPDIQESALFWDHPRVCGEKFSRSESEAAKQGSPPRMRGKAEAFKALLVTPGITPAYAGKSYSGSFSFFTPSDHPRVCGEKPDAPSLWLAPLGSPPRMRGKAQHYHQACYSCGITPACAGKSLRIPRCATRWREHPRACGEKYFSLQVRRSVLYSF